MALYGAVPLLVMVLVVLIWSDHVTSQGSQQSTGSRGASCSNNYQFDQLVLSIQWPLSFCYDKQGCNLKIARNKKWLIHGLWPNRSQRSPKPKTKRNSGPSSDIAFCCGPAYNQSVITPTIYRELLDKWPTLHSNAKHHGFWRHEWSKHGTCARQVTSLKSQQAYFETVLGLYNRFNLNRASLQSNQTYQLEQFHREIEPLVDGKRVRIECSLANSNQNNNNNKTSIFAEVHICLDKTLQPIDCNRNDDHQCKKRILFP